MHKTSYNLCRKELDMKKKFDYSFLKGEYLPASIINYIATIERSRGLTVSTEMNYPQVYAELEKQAKINSVKGSNAIEGIYTSDERIRSIVSGITMPLDHSEQEISGYRDALTLVHENHLDIPVSEDSIKKLHAIMLVPSLTEHAEDYKTDDNIISEEHSDGSRSVVFSPPSVEDTPELMHQLLLAYKEANQDPGINKLLLIPCFVLDYLCIHPFLDGNGRTSRLLTLLLFYKNGYSAGKYISFEEKINQDRNAYYDAIRKCSEFWYDDEPEYIPFIEYTLKKLAECYADIASRFDSVGNTKLKKSERIKLAITKSIVPKSKQDLIRELPDISQTTIEAELTKLQKQGIIMKIGQGRATKYIAGE